MLLEQWNFLQIHKKLQLHKVTISCLFIKLEPNGVIKNQFVINFLQILQLLAWCGQKIVQMILFSDSRKEK